MQQDHIILINLLDVLGHPLSGLVQALGLVHHGRFKIAALVVLLIKLVDVFIGEGLIVKSDGVVVGLAFSDDLVQDIAILGINGQVRTVLLLWFKVLLKLLKEDIAFLLQLLLLFDDLIALDPLQIDKVQLGILLELYGKLSVNLGNVDDLVGLLRGVKGILDDPFFEGYHLFMDLLREGAVELLNLHYEVEELLFYLFDVLESAEDTVYLLDQVLALLGPEH